MTAKPINTYTVEGREPSISETCNTCKSIFHDAPPDDPQRYGVDRQSLKDQGYYATHDKQGRIAQECCNQCVEDMESERAAYY